MNKTIKTYEDLVVEEQRLTAQLALYKGLIQEDIAGVKAGLKEKLNPVKKIKTTLQNLFVHEGKNGPVLNFMINFVLDFIIRLFIPRRTSVWTKTVIPFLTKNYISHLVTDEQRVAIAKAVNKVLGKIDQFVRNTLIKKQEEQFGAASPVPDAAPVHPGQH